jgi:hypothetical protein
MNEMKIIISMSRNFFGSLLSSKFFLLTAKSRFLSSSDLNT